MKSILKISAVFGLLFVLNSCGPTARDFIGKWEVYDLELQSEWRGNIVDDEMRAEYEDVIYEFLPEGKMKFHNGGDVADGTWSTDGENLNMNFAYNDWTYQDLKCKILSCTAGKMALSLKLKQNETWILYFQKKE